MFHAVHTLLCFEDFELDLIRGSISRGGKQVDLRPKTFQVLRVLVENAGRLIAKDEIIQAVWPDVVVTEDSLVQCVRELRLAFGDGDQKIIRTVPRRGYLFDAPVSFQQAETAAQKTLAYGSGAKVVRDKKLARMGITALVLLLSIAVITSIALHRSGGTVMPEQMSIAVLPFINLSGDRLSDVFSKALADDLLTNLTKFPDLRIAARKSSFGFSEQHIRVNEIGQALGVRYLLEGSVRRDDKQWRIAAQIIDTQTEKRVWAEHYDRSLEDVPYYQDSIAQEIASTVASSVSLADARRIANQSTEYLSAREMVLRARADSFRAATKPSTIEARDLALRAIAIDPNLATAHVELGRTYYRAFAIQWEGSEALDKALLSARRAISLDQTSADAYELLGRVYLRRRQYEAALATLQKTISLNPNRAASYASLADTLTFIGRANEAVPLLEKAMQLDPFYPPRVDMYLGRALYFIGRFDQAALALETCVARASGFRPCYMYVAAVYAELGRSEDAQGAVEKLLELAPNFSISGSVLNHLPYTDAPMRRYTESLRKAGVPEN